MSRDHLYFGALIMMGLSVVACLYGLWAVAVNGFLWLRPETRGVVVAQRTWHTGGRHELSRSYLQVAYEYSVDGTLLTGWQINRGYDEWQDDQGRPVHSFSLGRDRDKAAARYHEGAGVTVHYDPDDPSDSILEVGLTRYEWAGLLGGPVFFGFGFLLFRSLKGNEAWAERKMRARSPGRRQS